jgi:deoxycytidylate deaminase
MYLELAKKIATRSSLRRYRTGCVIVRGDVVIATGWSHFSEQNLREYRSIHAEVHAIRRAGGLAKLAGSVFYIATLSERNTIAKGNPCECCSRLIEKAEATARYT